MNSEKIEKLSELVASIVEKSGKLKAEVQQLNKKIEELESENRAVVEQNQKTQADLKKLHALESSNRKMEKEKSIIQSKVNTLLENLEKMNFA